MTLPDGWTVIEKTIEGSKLCVMNPPTGWTVSEVSGDFVYAGGGKKYAVGNAGWIVNIGSKEALSAEGWVRVDKQQMRFVGTGGACSVESTAEKKLTILERLAKSKAKAVAIS
jgi:3-phosphoglycerate kinase